MSMDIRTAPCDQIDGKDNLFQSPFWARFKSASGWTPRGFHYTSPWGSGSLLVLSRRTGCGGVAHVPRGPDLVLPAGEQGPFLEELSRRLEEKLPPGCLYLRYDLPWRLPYGEGGGAVIPRADGAETEDPRPRAPIRELRMNFGTSEWNLRKAPTDLLPPDTVVIDLRRAEERILAGMSSTARYNVRMAGRRGVEVQAATVAELPVWYRLYSCTCRRHGLRRYPRSYFRDLFEAAGGSPGATRLRLLLARVGRSVTAGMILALQGRRATYLFGASAPGFGRLAPSHRLQWRAIQIARARGCACYDLFGIPPSANPSHPMHGLLRFKSGFGGEIVRYRGCWDFPLQRRSYEQVRGMELGGEPFHVRL
jgi:lipid II:glycine glycyltransferase (peptidoglycan interpeptide bridge formation enzyme)